MSEPTTAQTVGHIFGPAAYLIAKAVETEQEFGNEEHDSANDPWFVKTYRALKDGKSPFAAEGDEKEEAKISGITIWSIINFISLVIIAAFVYVSLFDKNVLAKRGMTDWGTGWLILIAIVNFIIYGIVLSPLWGLTLMALIPTPHFMLPAGYEIFPLEAMREVMADKRIPESEKSGLVKYVAMLLSARSTTQHLINMDKMKTPAQFGHFYY